MVSLDRELASTGVVLARGLIDRAAAVDINNRFRSNLKRLTSVFPRYTEDANRNVFPISVAMADPSEPTLPARLAEAALSNILGPSFVSQDEQTSLERFVAPVMDVINTVGRFRMAGLDNCYARYESARPNSPYDHQAIHQDAVFQLYGLTAWIALSRSGRDAPSLQFIRRKRRALLPTRPGVPFIDKSTFWPWQWTRPAYEPGDVVIFDHYTVHGTYITPSMSSSRTSLDVRFRHTAHQSL